MFGRKVLLLAVLALALPAAAFASSQVDFTNMGGTLAGTNAGLTLTGSTLIAVQGLNGGGLITGSNLGSVGFTTGALASGSLQTGGTFAAGGNFTITGNGSRPPRFLMRIWEMISGRMRMSTRITTMPPLTG